jgi:K+-sensing histidine kinase KdpD
VRHRVNADVVASLSALLSLAVAAALVGVRDQVHPEVTAVALAAVVAVAGRFGGRVAGVTSALVAALSFDFFHTRPYLSLKIENTTDVLVTVLLCVVGLIVGTHQQGDDRRALARVLGVARRGRPAEIELAVRRELVALLGLEQCWFTRDDPPAGALTIPVTAFGRAHGHLVCVPSGAIGADARKQRRAAELADVLALAMGSQPRS